MRTPMGATLAAVAAACALALPALMPARAIAAAPLAGTPSPGWARFMVGRAEFTALNDGTAGLQVDRILHAPAEFVAQALRERAESEPVESSVNAWLVNTGTRLVLVDAGAGHYLGPTRGNLVAQIRAAGYRPEQVDDVLLTHLHPDHVGGLVTEGRRVFPNATVHAGKADADWWLSTAHEQAASADARAGFEAAMATLGPYLAAGRFQAVEGDGEVVPGIRAVAAPGHTPGHTIYALESDGKRLVMIGDLIHVAAVQLRSPGIGVSFDTDEVEAATTRRRVLDELAASGAIVAVSHFSFPGVGHLRAEPSQPGWTWIPLDFSSHLP